MNHFCTISTVSHLYKVYALAESLQKQKRDFTLHVLVTDSDINFTFNNCCFRKPSDLNCDPTTKGIIRKYSRYPDKLRWSLKPVFIKYLLEHEADKVIYLDNDLFFYSDYQFLFDLLNEYSFLLTPHYYKHHPKKEQNWLEANFKVGLFNAGFVGSSKKSTNTLTWWAECCEYRCEKNMWRGLFDDQKYLDLIPIIDENAYIVRNKGCNVASWNSEFCERKTINGELRINEKYPVVFIHFNSFTIREISAGNDALLSPFLEEYEATLKKYKPDLKLSQLYKSEPLLEKFKFHVWQLITNAGL